MKRAKKSKNFLKTKKKFHVKKQKQKKINGI